MRGKRFTFLPALISAALLSGMATDRLMFHQPPGDAEPYHARVKAVVEKFPVVFGEWYGGDVEVPPEAVALLRPNIIISRRYENISTKASVSYLLVHCRETRDLTGHYPPNCYPSMGWMEKSRKPREWDFGWGKVTGTEYRFQFERFASSGEGIVIYSCMALPSGRIVGDMDSVYEAASDPKVKHFGAGQIQLVCDAKMPPEQREAAFEQFMNASRDILDEIRFGAR